MRPIDAARLAEVRASLTDGKTRLVGWGSGSVFDYFHSRYPVALDCLVDNDASRWGTSRRGVPIVAPASLLGDQRDTVIIIYSSAWPEIQRQIAMLCGVLALPASAVFADEATCERLTRADAIASRAVASSTTPRSFRRSIVVQGPVWSGITSHVLRVLRVQNPTDAIVLSTWEDTDLDTLTSAAALVDEVVVSERPRPHGIQNRNAQIVSTRAGIERAIGAGAETILKTRTDLAVLTPQLFDRGAAWLSQFSRDAARAAGLRGRIVVPASFTRKFLLYHPSDLVMLGAADDLWRYWSAPLDMRTGELLSPQWLDRSLAAVNMDGNPAESYLGLHFCRTLGRAASGTVRDSWDFYRDLFAVVDNDWFELLWFKNLSIPDAAVTSGVRQLVSQAFWERLQAGEAAVEDELHTVDVDRVALRALSEAA